MSRFLIVGLGNPGPEYEATRHNVGFMAVERLGQRLRISLTQTKFHGRYATGHVGPTDVVLLKPQTFMNLSGKSVAAAGSFFKIDPEEVIVLHDEIDLPLGSLRVKIGGGHAGHNGLRDIISHLGSRDFVRVRLGVGRPAHGDVTHHVLGKFRSQERAIVDEMIERACDAVEAILRDGAQRAQNQFNAG